MAERARPDVDEREIVEEGGDPACWAHLFEDSDDDAPTEDVAAEDAARPA